MLSENNPTGDNSIPLKLTDSEIESIKPMMWESNIIELSVPSQTKSKDDKISWVVKPTIEDKAIRVQDLMVLEILTANNWQRPVYFSSTVMENNKVGLYDYLTLEGLVYRFKSTKEKISAERLKQNIFENYTFEAVADEHLKYVDEIKLIYQNYRYCYANLVESYLDKGKKDLAKETLTALNNNLPESKLPFMSEKLKKYITELEKKSSE